MNKVVNTGVIAVLALTAMSTTAVPVVANASTVPHTAKSVNLGGKYGHYHRYTKKLPKSIKGTWYTLSKRNHRYFDQAKFVSYKKIVTVHHNSSINLTTMNLIGKPVYGNKLFFNGHWFMVMGMAQGPSFYVKKMRLAGKKRSVLIRFEQGKTTYYLRNKFQHYYQFLNKQAPGSKYAGNR